MTRGDGVHCLSVINVLISLTQRIPLLAEQLAASQQGTRTMPFINIAVETVGFPFFKSRLKNCRRSVPHLPKGISCPAHVPVHSKCRHARGAVFKLIQ